MISIVVNAYSLSVLFVVGSSVVYELRAYQCGGLKEALSMLGIFVTDLTSTFTQSSLPRPENNLEWPSLATFSSVECIKNHIGYRLQEARYIELHLPIIYRESIVS